MEDVIVTDDTKTDVVADDSKKTEDIKSEDVKTGEEILPDGTTAPKKTDATVTEPKEPVEHVAWKLREEKRAREALAAENAELKARLSTPVEGEPDIAPYIDEYGQFKDAKSQVEYNKKFFEWQGNQRDKLNAQKVSQQRNNEAMSALTNAYVSDAEKAGKKYPDFYEVVEKSPFTFAMEKAIKLSNNKAEVAYYICKNPELQKTLLNSDPVDTALEIHKIDLQLSQKLNQKIVSNAPPPINPVEGNTDGIIDENKLSTKEWIKRQNEKEIKKRR